MKNKWKWILGAAVVAFVLLQFTNPARTNPSAPPEDDLMATNAPPPEIATLLQGACYDCHSDQTRWPWYSHVAPVSWLIASDVRDGRRHVNFSEWPHAYPGRAARLWENISEELGYHEMPPAQYKLMHPQARLTDAERRQLIQWADQEAKRLKAITAPGK
ncbi:MAG: heme-binding domain-containing protein [Verrucomicrobiia bacterium]